MHAECINNSDKGKKGNVQKILAAHHFIDQMKIFRFIKKFIVLGIKKMDSI